MRNARLWIDKEHREIFWLALTNKRDDFTIEQEEVQYCYPASNNVTAKKHQLKNTINLMFRRCIKRLQ